MPFPNPDTQFKPGNPGGPGRPKGSGKLVNRMHHVLATEAKPGVTVADVFIDQFIKQACKGKFPFAKELLDRIEGKVPDRIAGPDGGGLTIRYVNNWRAGDDEGAGEPPQLPSPDDAT